MRSSWGKVLRRRWKHSGKQWSLPVVIQWRVQALFRVLTRLSRWIPISQVVIVSPTNSNVDLKIQQDTQQVRSSTIRCAYCGRRTLHLERDHLFPQSRMGSDAWRNRVWACTRCNTIKGEQTPDEAGMKVLLKRRQDPPRSKRIHPYIRQTARLLAHQLQNRGWIVEWPEGYKIRLSFLTPDLADALQVCIEGRSSVPRFIAKPIAHPRKQVFTARNYPRSTPLGAGFEVKERTIKRRLRINRGLALWRTQQKSRTTVIEVGQPIPEDADLFISAGLLCEAQRAGKKIVGIVNAIHSTGRLTVLVPKDVNSLSVGWDRVVISPRSHFRVLGKDRVLFLALPSISDLESGDVDT